MVKNLNKTENLKTLLNNEFHKRNSLDELTTDRPDPLFVASKYNNEYIALVCALFAYGNAHQIIKFLSTLDFSLLDAKEIQIKTELKNSYYRFQKGDDVINFFIALRRLKLETSLEDIFYEGYKKENNILEGIDNFISKIKGVYDYSSYGYDFLIGKPLKRDKNKNIKYISNAPYKRYNMFLRWMVRDDNIDLGLWNCIDKKDLVLPLDTHTFNVCKKLGLLQRKTYNLQSAMEITNNLKLFDQNDPIKYDFAIYRLGQEKII
jgi:uncharacterized protein (TIGR02757 family)